MAGDESGGPMSAQGRTPEPKWKPEELRNLTAWTSSWLHDHEGDPPHGLFARRAYACVVACASLPDPERDVAEMRGLLFRCGEFLNDLGYGETELSERIRAILARFDAKEATP
jgi:hypothetical protein